MKSIKIKSGFPTVWADLAYQNQLLKRFATGSIIVAFLSLSMALLLAKRKPIITTVDTHACVLPATEPASLEDEVDHAVRAYVKYRYEWKNETLSLQFLSAKYFVASQSIKAFEKTASDLATFLKGKSVSQRIYATGINVDTKAGKAQVTADRFTEIQGLKAATVLRTNLIYQTGPRTEQNPWGIYVIKEEEIQ
jgi:hypothetical protein